MKKSFLVLGVLGSLCATNGYAVASSNPDSPLQVEKPKCDPCTLQVSYSVNDDHTEMTTRYTCVPTTPGQVCPKALRNAPNKIKLQAVSELKNSRSAAIMPKMTKKVVYEEIISDEDMMEE